MKVFLADSMPIKVFYNSLMLNIKYGLEADGLYSNDKNCHYKTDQGEKALPIKMFFLLMGGVRVPSVRQVESVS